MTKKPQKPQKRVRKSSTAARSKKPSTVALAHTKFPLRHFRLVSHAHTGKLIHHRHSSHPALVLMLLVVGIFLVISQQMSGATSGTVTIGAVVNGPPPTVGATITSPVNGAVLTDQTSVVVSGTCSPSTFVVVQRNSVLAGSTNCSGSGVFSLTISVVLGQNVLSALNYDNVNQAGPATPEVTITVTQTDDPDEPGIEPPLPSFPIVPLPENPSIIPGLPNPVPLECRELSATGTSVGLSRSALESCAEPVDCETYTPTQPIPSGGRLAVDVVCVPRILQQNTAYTIGLIVSGGFPPYALSIDLGNDDTLLLSVSEPGYITVPFSYDTAGAFNITVNVSDVKGARTSVETGVQVSGEGRPIITALTDALSPTNWLTSPVPLYAVAVFVTLAFWGGDIFYRRFGVHKPSRPHTRRRAT